jgi:hypothetical protein
LSDHGACAEVQRRARLADGVWRPGSTYNGGGVWIAGGLVTVTDCTLAGNTAVNGAGGAILAPMVTLTGANLVFANHAALSGGIT